METPELIKESPPGKRTFRALVIPALVLAIPLFTFLFLMFLTPALAELHFSLNKIHPGYYENKGVKRYKKEVNLLSREIRTLQNKFRNLTPWNAYLVVNTTDNRFVLYRNRKPVRTGVCSTGSYILLKSHDKSTWIFQTPKGVFTILGKITSPVWRRPDWSFIEEGLPVPPPDHISRYEAGVLGDYALSIGHGYLIHGTIYTRFFGMPVTHGCIRLKDEDLEVVYHSLDIGSKVYIY